MSTRTTQSDPAQDGFSAKLLARLRALCDRILDPLDDGEDRATAPRSSGDPWNDGYRAGRRAGYRHAGPDDDADPVVHRAPHPEGSGAAALWWQGFKIGFCDGAAERP